MSYRTRVTGSITITPPIPWSLVKGSPFVAVAGGWVEKDVQLHIVEQIVETGDGTLIRRDADAIVPAYDDRYKTYEIVEHVQELVDVYGEGRTFAGRLEGKGESPGDLWRLYVRDGRAVRVEPQIVWPDDEVSA